MNAPSRHLVLVPLAVALALGAGCATVKPWQRGTLADPLMQPDLLPDQVILDQHFLLTVEGAAGGYDVAGGGCGCG
jgi:hypothetical protein